MSRSYRTQKESIKAERKLPHTKEGELKYPRIVEKPLPPGFIHPLSKHQVFRFLKKIPPKYFYGLKQIELRSRKSSLRKNIVGQYYVKAKQINLYALPEKILSDSYLEERRLEMCFWALKESNPALREAIARWPSWGILALYQYKVLAHELGHHYAHQYRSKNKLISGRKYNELNANMHCYRLIEEFFNKKFKKRTLAFIDKLIYLVEKAESLLDSRPFIEVITYPAEIGSFHVTLTPNFRDIAIKKRVWKTKLFIEAIACADCNYQPKDLWGRPGKGLLILDKNPRFHEDLSSKIVKGYLEKPGSGAKEVAKELGIKINKLRPACIINRKMRFLGILARIKEDDWLVLVDYDDAK